LTDPKLLSAIDDQIKAAFEKKGCATKPGQEYLRFSGLTYSSVPDMSLSFFGSNYAFAICHRCEKESRGLHLHVFPGSDKVALEYLSDVTRDISNPINRMNMLDYNIGRLTWDHKMTVLSVIVAFVSYLVVQSTNLFSSVPFTDIFMLLSSFTFVLTILYLILVMILVLARAIYAYKFVWRI